MTTVDSMFPSKFMKASDLHGDTRVTIVGIEQREVGDREVKPVVVFHEAHHKPMVLNRTNANAISEILGTSDTRGWIGKQVVLYPTHTEYQGKRVAAIRVRYEEPGRSDHQAPPPRVGNGYHAATRPDEAYDPRWHEGRQ